jgi:transmembrane sensor
MLVDKKLLEKYAAGKASPEEINLVENWLKEEAEQWQEAVEGEETHLNRIWARISPKTEFQRTNSIGDSAGTDEGLIVSGPRWRSWPWIAASILLLFGIGTFYVESRISEPVLADNVLVSRELVTITTANGEKKRVLLPDGSTVHLNAGSEMVFPQFFFKDDSVRTISFKGEAFFDIAPDTLKPFVINSGNAMVRVLGTRFNLRWFAEEPALSVVVEEGRVLLQKSNSKEELLITPGHIGEITKNGRVTKRDVYLSKYTSWTRGRLVFSNHPIKSIKTELERWYGVSIQIQNEDYLESRYTGSFQDQPIEEVMKMIAYTVGFKYRIYEKNIVIIY